MHNFSMTNSKFFPRAYGLETQEDIDKFYTEWADTYDEEVIENGYASPYRTAQALLQFCDTGVKIMDIGCGTGLSGVALRSAGFKNIYGSEINPKMLEHARKRSVYLRVDQGKIDKPFPEAVGTYDVITAIGVIGAGAAPVSLLESCIDALISGGLCAFSLNDSTLADHATMKTIEDLISSGKAHSLFCQYGEHLPSKNIGSMVYVLRKS